MLLLKFLFEHSKFNAKCNNKCINCGEALALGSEHCKVLALVNINFLIYM